MLLQQRPYLGTRQVIKSDFHFVQVIQAAAT